MTPKEDISAAVKLTLSASPEDLQRQDTDEWWRERRVLARKLIDLGDAATAYQVVRNVRPSGQSLLSCRVPLHGRLDRTALSRRSDHCA